MRYILGLFLLTPFFLHAQAYDGQWVFGYGVNEANLFGLSMLDFKNDEVSVSYWSPAIQRYYSLGFTGSILSDRNGGFKYLTNHCSIYDAAWQRVTTDSLLTTTGHGAAGCLAPEDSEDQYSSLQGCILLPDLLDSNLTYVLHKDQIIDFDNQDLYSEHFWFSTIYEDSSGSYTFNKKYTINQERLDVENLTAIPNASRTAWWVLIHRQNSNVFERFLIRHGEAEIQDTQTIGRRLIGNDLGIGQAQYSPQGNYFAINTEEYGVVLYRFDPATGLLSDARSIPYPDSRNVAKGMCFSPNERFIYVTTAENVYQIDLEQNDEVYHLGYYRSFDQFNWPVGLGMIFGGPDCRLYVSPGTGTYFMHVILHPNQKGDACGFTERAIELPGRVAHHLPNMAQFRYLTGCDSSIHFPFTPSSDEVVRVDPDQWFCYPNPVRDMLHLELPEVPQRGLEVELLDARGHRVAVKSLDSGQAAHQIDVSFLAPGVYFLKDMESKRKVQRIVKVD